MKSLHMVAWILVMIGGINWLLIGVGGFVSSGAADWNVVHLLLGQWPPVEWIVYILVGLSAVYEIVKHKKNCMMCSANKPMTPTAM